MSKNNFVHPEVLVDTDWAANNLKTPNIRFVEVDVDTAAYDSGHIPGAVGWNWQTETQDPLRRDIPSKASFEQLLSRSGISNDSTIVLYGDNNNWFATYAFWLLKIYGHKDVRLIDGGRKKWAAESRELVKDLPHYETTKYKATEANFTFRAGREDVLAGLGNPGRALVDVRSAGEFSGELLAPAALPQEGAQRGGHIPGAQNIPWGQAVAEDGTFKSSADLKQIYGPRGVLPEKEIIAYCRIGERSSHSWFVLHYLLGYEKVRNYDGSWTEWGSSIAVPIERS